ncbi:MAG: Z1 domain-containing protein [Candidatus Competibacteraceae bacterium]|nr:Z1 domain-containing protein [Candidatus Competibacteraceae bacterium]
MNASEQKIVKMAQEMLLEVEDRASITPAIIRENIDLVVSLYRRKQPDWGKDADYNTVTDELIRRFSQWIGKDSTLQDEEGHIPWLTAARKQEWSYWQRYREWLERKLSFVAVDALDQSTDHVLGLLEDPQREEVWDRRGLVVGHVQSGKTSHYTGLICKAADAGYKIIIVLAGLHNNLRSQTQIRLDEGFLGYETGPAASDNFRIIGVGEINSDPNIRPNFATNRSDKGDFNTKVAQHFGITPEKRPWLFVVKKNKTVLKRLLTWIRNQVANAKDPETGRKIVTHLPLLLIDDEADHASVDTGNQIFDEQGHPDPQHEPTAINRLVRQILHAFAHCAYVGYTATPFANIFIHDRGTTHEDGPDLFPSGFIINLAAPSNYVGPARVFGLRIGDSREDGLPLLRAVADYAISDGSQAWMPQRHKTTHLPRHKWQDCLPPSLVEAIDAFLLSCAVRQLRGQGRDHASMLVHVTRFNAVQKEVARQVTEHVRHIKQRLQRKIDHQILIERLAGLWERDFAQTRAELEREGMTGAVDELPPWHDILAVLPDIAADLQVRTINGTAKDALDYVEHRETGLKVIAIGGDKLARGLTLEGLSVSYFLRASRMYDTLMQMGRWFGYRPGYLDVCRLYTTDDLIEWFGHITDASEELRQEFGLMVESGGTPRDYGLRVQSHPVLMVTSPLKMRTAKSLMLSFSGCILETVALYRDMMPLQHNLAAFQTFMKALAAPSEVNPERWRNGSRQLWEGYLWNEVSHEPVIEFLTQYQTHPAARKVNGAMLAEFIGSMVEIGELTSWTVALIGGGDGEKATLGNNLDIRMLKRARKGDYPDRYSIGRLLSPRDEAIDLDEAAWLAALAETQHDFKPDPGRLHESLELPKIPSGPAIRKVRGFGAEGIPAHPERGLLMFYVLDPQHAALTAGTPPVVAFGISFPGSHAGRKVEYKVNNVLWEQWELEYGPAD